MYSFYNPNRVRVAIVFDEESLTKQSEAQACDINNIMRRYQTTGVIDHVNRVTGAYLDVFALPDYQSALHTVSQAEDAFFALPATLRARFDNDPAKLIAFVKDPANRKEALALGILREHQTTLDVSPPTPSTPSADA